MAKKKPQPDKPDDSAVERLVPPADGATVRFYRTGHGDCFLLAFAGSSEDRPVYVLIDCGYKPGSPKHINTNIKDITASIRQATGGHIDVAVITHEHQDHVNGITKANFEGITIGTTWLAWTDDPEDKLADQLRKQFHDKLLGLIAARNRLSAAGDDVNWLDQFLEFELGGADETFSVASAQALLAAEGGASNSMNKRSMKLFKDRAEEGVKFLRPHQRIIRLPGAKDVRVFVLGPPRNEAELKDLDPQEGEQFHKLALASSSPGNYFASAALSADNPDEQRPQSPLSHRYSIPLLEMRQHSRYGSFFRAFYEPDQSSLESAEGVYQAAGVAHRRGSSEVPGNADWRRIETEWLYSAESLAIDISDFTNNSSLVLAFELGRDGKVLLFAADAQRGNWISWTKKTWKDGDKTITARDLLARTVLYKCGHHGSHNATLNGAESDVYPNLSWFAAGEHAQEFAAMITAVRSWAETQKGWDHPLASIKTALLKKASGRVFQTDTDFDDMEKPEAASKAGWKRFQQRARGDRLFFDLDITPE